MMYGGGIPHDFVQNTQGANITALQRRAKYILLHTNREQSIILHLGMSGRIRIYNDISDYISEPHDHVFFDMQQGQRIVFQDPRRFGMLYTAPFDTWEQQSPFSQMGPEPLDNDFNAHFLMNALKNKKAPIKTALLDQKLVVGLGNIYVCEALFRAKINPMRLCSTLTAIECQTLTPIIKQVLREAIASGGSTLKDYKKTDGSLGYFQHSFQVDGREGEPCTNINCQSSIIRCAQAGRSTFYCDKCQL